MEFRLRGALYFIAGIVYLFFASCGNHNNNPAASPEMTELDSLVVNAHALIDTGYNENYRPLVKHLESLEKRCIAKGNTEGLARVYYMRGSMERWRQNYLEGLNWCHKGYEQVKNTNTNTEMDILLEIGDIYRDLNKKRLANEFYLRAYDIARKTSGLLNQAFVTSRLGIIFFAQSDYDLALESFKSTLQVMKNANYTGEHNTKKLQLYNNIGLCYVQKGIYDTAMIYYDSALRHGMTLDKKIRNVGLGVVNGNIGRLYQLKGEYDIAISKLKYNVEINSQQGNDNGDAVTSYTYLLEIYNLLDSNLQFEKDINKAIALTYTVKQGRMKEWRARLMGLLSSYYAKRGDYRDAYLLQTRQLGIQDSINKMNETENLQDLILFRDLMEKSQMVEKLEGENASSQSSFKTLVVASVLGLVILGVVIFFLVTYRRNLKEQKKLNGQIAFQNEQITLNKSELEQAIEELKMMNNEKNRMLGMVAHDLRGPIYNITGVVQLLEGSAAFSQLSDTDRQLMELIQKSCDNALEVINDLLEAAHLDNSGSGIEKKMQNLSEIIQSALRMYENRARQKQIELVFNEPMQPVMAVVSKDKINRALGNLVSNAIKFSHAGSKVNIVLSQVNSHVLISVADEGMGIPNDYKDVIFDKFTRAKRHGTEGEKPVGLGMSIVKQIVDAHHGRIWFDSEENRGTTFFIELPVEG